MTSAILPIFSLLLGAAILLLGNGLQGILIPVRATLENFATSSIGLIASAYSIGFAAGCFLVPHIVRRVGHIRAFAALAAVAASVVLVLALIPHPIAWIALRVVSGFCFAGIFMVIESWLNEKSTNTNRGQIFSVYMIIQLGAVTAGQMLLPTGDPALFTLFAITCIAITLGLVPVSLTTSSAPAPIGQVKLRLKRLYHMSPVGVIGCFFVGNTNGAFLNLGAVYAQSLGLSLTSVALFMSFIYLGGALSQFPIGRLSDRIDRRKVMIGVCLGSASLGIILAIVGGVTPPDPALATVAELSPQVLLFIAPIFGFCALPLYSLCVAHTNDYVGSEDFVEASSGLLLTYGIGSVFGPMIASFLMQSIGPGGLFAFTATVHLCFTVFALYRITRRAPVPAKARAHFVDAGTSRSTPALVELDPRAPEHEPQAGSKPAGE